MADKKFEPKPHAYPRTSAKAASPAPQRVEISVGKAERVLAPPKPDAASLSLTGRYEGDGGLSTLQVNQAGRGVVCWLVDYKTKALTKFEGIEASPQSVDLNVEFSSTKAGQLSQVVANEVILNLGNSTSLFRLVGKGPVLSDSALLILPPEAKQLATRQERFPLTFSDKQRIRRAVSAATMTPMIEAWLNAPNDPDVATRFKRGQLAEVIDNHIGTLFDSLHPSDHPLAEELAQQELMAQDLSHDDETRSLIDWLQTITTRSEAERLGPTGEMNRLEQHLKLTKTGTGRHFYKFTLTVIGPSGDFGVGLGGFLGSLEVNETDESGDSVVRPVGTFTLVMGQASLGPSAGVSIGFTTSGSAESPYVWRASNIPGSFRMVDVGAGVSTPVPVPPKIRGSAFSLTTVMFLIGNGELPQLVIDFGGFSQQFGIGAGASISGALGYIFSAANPPKVTPGSHRVEQNYTTQRKAETQVHFKFGSALLTDEGRQLLRLLCANELAAFSSPGSQLTINSHADRVDTEARNLELSDLRAKNTLQAMRDILGNSLLPDARVALRGLGEQGAIEAGDRDHTSNPVRRKSEVVINSRLVLSLFGKQ